MRNRNVNDGKDPTMSSVRHTMMSIAMVLGVLAAAGIGTAAEPRSLAPRPTIPAAASTQGPGVFATPNDLGAELSPLSATPRVPWTPAPTPVAGSGHAVGTAALAECPNSLALNG